jgi:hypothetical protein
MLNNSKTFKWHNPCLYPSIATLGKNKAARNNSSDGKITESTAASGTAQCLEEVLDNLDLKTIGAPMLRTLLAQTM